MTEYIVVADFSGSPDGARVVRYNKGDKVPSDSKPMPASLAEVALQEKWIKKAARRKPARTRRAKSPQSPAPSACEQTATE